MIEESDIRMQVEDANRLDAAKKAKAAGRLVVGLIGVVAPVELVLATGCMAVTLTARAEDWEVSSEPMEAGHEPEIRSLFRQALDGVFEACDLLVVPSTSDGFRFLFQYLKEMVRQGRGDRVPPLLHYDFMFGRTRPVHAYSFRVFREFAHRLSVLTGRELSDFDLLEAMELTNRVRRQLRRLDALRNEGRVSGAEAHQAIRAGAFLEPHEYAGQLAQWVDARLTAPVRLELPRVLLVPAVPLYHDRLHQLLEDAGALVTGEDDEWGSRKCEADLGTSEPHAETIFNHYYEHAWSPRGLRAEREAWVTAQMQSGQFDGVVFYIPPSDQYFGWRYPDLKAMAERSGLATLLVRADVLDPTATAALKTQVEQFVAAIRPQQGMASGGRR